MKQRCLNPKDRAYSNYGGRGITVCDRWKDSFENFYEDMGARPTLQHEIERNDNNGNYDPDNCTWETPVKQANNRRSNAFYEYNGVRKTIAQWAREFNLTYAIVFKRLKRGWDISRAVTTPETIPGVTSAETIRTSREIETLKKVLVQIDRVMSNVNLPGFEIHSSEHLNGQIYGLQKIRKVIESDIATKNLYNLRVNEAAAASCDMFPDLSKPENQSPKDRRKAIMLTKES